MMNEKINAVLVEAGFGDVELALVDTSVIASTKGFKALSFIDQVKLAQAIADAKQIVVPSGKPAYKKDEVPTIGNAFSSLYCGSASDGGFKLYGIPAKDSEGKTKTHHYQAQVGISIIPAVEGTQLVADKFDKAEVVYHTPEVAWSDEKVKQEMSSLYLVSSYFGNDANVFLNSLKVKVSGIEFPLVNYLQEVVIPNLADSYSFLLKQNKNGGIKLVSNHWTQKESPFREA